MQSWYQDLLEDRLNALRSFAGRRVSLNASGLTGRIHSLPSSGRRESWTDWSRTIMKTLLLRVLSMVAVAWEATAQDAQCVRERAAMVETIRAYARSDTSVLGQQGMSERVLEAM